jgi:hypothetical protein
LTSLTLSRANIVVNIESSSWKYSLNNNTAAARVVGGIGCKCAVTALLPLFGLVSSGSGRRLLGRGIRVKSDLRGKRKH